MAFIGPAHIDIIPWNNYKAVSGFTPARTQSSAALTGGALTGSSSTAGNYVTWDVPLMAGTWTVTLLYSKSTAAGVITASLDGVDLSGTVDGYNGSTTYSNVNQWTGVSVATGGVKEFKLRCDTKNGSSSSYYPRPQLITFTNTDAPTQTFTCAGPSRFDIIPYGYWGQTAGSAPSRSATGGLSGGCVTQASSASNTIGWYVPLTAGTWALDTILTYGTDGGILTITADGATIGTADTYAGSTTYSNVSTITGISVTTSKYVLLKYATATKNGSSSGYVPRIQHIALRKTA